MKYDHPDYFRPRGLGTDHTPGCFICGGEPGLYTNISAFVASKEAGERVVSFFKHGAWLDYRSHEPDWVQVKIGACGNHTIHLRLLMALTQHGVIDQQTVDRCYEAK